MTEYDYSPEAYEKYLAAQHRIARWVDETSRSPLKNPFTPATPAVHLSDLPLQKDEAGTLRHPLPKRPPEHHRKQPSKSYTRPPSPHSSKKPVSSRQRSMSYSTPTPRPPPTRSQTAPQQQRGYPPDSISREHSGRSSQTSSTQPFSASTAYLGASSSSRPNSSSTVKSYSYPLPHQQYPDYDAVRPREPLRSNTAPAHIPSFPMDKTHYGYPAPGFPYQSEKASAYVYQSNPTPVIVPLPNGSHTYMLPAQSQKIDVSKIPQQPQLPFSVYERPPKKQLPLLRRLFTGFGSNKNRDRSLSSGVRTPDPSPTKTKLRHRRSSFNL